MFNYPSPFAALHDAIQTALNRDLPDVISLSHDGNTSENRPNFNNIEVILFNQTWTNTACGYEHQFAGQAMCNAYTVLVKSEEFYAVYFGTDKLAYLIDLENMSDMGRKCFLADLNARKLKSVREAKELYK